MHTLESGMRRFEPSYSYKVSELLAFIRAAVGITPLSEEDRRIAFEERSRFTTWCLRTSIWLKRRGYSIKNLRLVLAMSKNDHWVGIRRPLCTR
jgi:hypothetical protein